MAKAKATGITHVYPRMGSHWDGFNARKYLDAFLPKAHAAGLKSSAGTSPAWATPSRPTSSGPAR